MDQDAQYCSDQPEQRRKRHNLGMIFERRIHEIGLATLKLIATASRALISDLCSMPVRLGLVLTSARADHPFCSAAFCSTHLCRHYFALACFALPRRNGSTPRPALGRNYECVDDEFLRRSLSLLYVPSLLLARADFAICLVWYGHW